MIQNKHAVCRGGCGDEDAPQDLYSEHRWSVVVRGLWLRRMLRGWVFRTDKLLEMDSQWRQACDNLQREALLYNLQATGAAKVAEALATVPDVDQFIDCTRIRFCAGPCESTLTETSAPGYERVFLRPRTAGQRFKILTYHLQNGVVVTVKNFRMCGSCMEHYTRLQQAGPADQAARDQMHADGMEVRRKLFQHASFVRTEPPAAEPDAT